jgi:hypothetical protein
MVKHYNLLFNLLEIFGLALFEELFQDTQRSTITEDDNFFSA